MDKLFLEVLISKIERGMFKSVVNIRDEVGSSDEASPSLKAGLMRGIGDLDRIEDALNYIKEYRDRKFFSGSVRCAKFEKVSYVRFLKDMEKTFPELKESDIEFLYNERVKLPVRATDGSAGYDIFTPVVVNLEPGESMRIPTGIRCKMLKEWVLLGCPRSGQGTNYRIQLDNTVAVIDSDYYYSDNEGHIFIKVTNDSKEGKEFMCFSGDAICQGLFLNYGITFDDNVSGFRNGGFGSTNK